ncbi:hypothetical protein [Tenacibaculum amylolyticum]|uniref:hypothetical protein n=1 Tax=Tenacibaculum amylolyticum TaxID=104269 RepID=UPI003892F00E
MQKHLYFVCPTDHIETVINSTFQEENYYWTTLGNSVSFTRDTIREMYALIVTKNITEITFVLSDDNKIVKDALQKQQFSEIRGLDNFYDKISHQRQFATLLWQTDDPRFPVISRYLLAKIQDLQLSMDSEFSSHVKIGAKIYNRNEQIFKKIYAPLFHLESFNLN